MSDGHCSQRSRMPDLTVSPCAPLPATLAHVCSTRPLAAHSYDGVTAAETRRTNQTAPTLTVPRRYQPTSDIMVTPRWVGTPGCDGWVRRTGYLGSVSFWRHAEKLLTEPAWGSASHGHG